jgi:hypothetical protein
MVNVKDQVYNALKEQEITENLGDGYPKEWAVLPAVQYMEEDNSVSEWTDNAEQKAHLLYRIDIWNNQSTSEAAIKVDKALSTLGLVRKQCNDVDDPSGLKHKIMRYEGILDIDTNTVHHNTYY